MNRKQDVVRSPIEWVVDWGAGQVSPMDGPELKFRFGRYVDRTRGYNIFSHRI